MRLTTMFLLATLAMPVNLSARVAQYVPGAIVACDYDGKVKNTLTGEPMVDPGDFVNDLRGSVTVNFFSPVTHSVKNKDFTVETLQDCELLQDETCVTSFTSSGQLNASWKSGGEAAFQFKNGFLKIEAAGDTEATFTLLVDNLRGSHPTTPNSIASDDDIWVVMPTRVSAGPESPVVNNVNVKDAYSTIFSLTSLSGSETWRDDLTGHPGTVGQPNLARANQAPNVTSDIPDYHQHTQNIFLNNHPSAPPESLQYRTFPVTFPDAVQELVSVELQIDLQDSGSAGSREIEVYGLTVTKDLSSLGLAIIPEPITLLLALLALAAVPLRVRSRTFRS